MHLTAGLPGCGQLGNSWHHNTFWTETWANYLSKEFWESNYWFNFQRFPIEPISLFNLLRLLAVKYSPIP